MFYFNLMIGLFTVFFTFSLGFMIKECKSEMFIFFQKGCFMPITVTGLFVKEKMKDKLPVWTYLMELMFYMKLFNNKPSSNCGK